MKKLKNNIIIGQGTASITCKSSWKINYKEDGALSIQFDNQPYPILGTSINSYDDPKAISRGSLDDYLLSNYKIQGSVLNKKKDNRVSTTYDITSEEGENLKVWRVAEILRPRHLRVLTLSLSWPDNKDANTLVKPIIKDINNIVKRVIFSKSLTKLDKIASASATVNKLRLTSLDLWEGFKIKLPNSWKLHLDEAKRSAEIKVLGVKDTFFLIDTEEVLLGEKRVLEEKNILAFGQQIVQDIQAEDLKISASGKENFLLTCTKQVLDEKEKIELFHVFWHRLLCLEGKLKISHFAFVHPVSDEEIFIELRNMLDREVRNAEIM